MRIRYYKRDSGVENGVLHAEGANEKGRVCNSALTFAELPILQSRFIAPLTRQKGEHFKGGARPAVDQDDHCDSLGPLINFSGLYVLNGNSFMTNLDARDFQTLVPQVVANLYERRRSPVTGAVLKLELIRRAIAEGKLFDQRTLGSGNFYDLVAKCNVTVQRRPGSDFVVLPKSAPATVEAVQPNIRIQRDIWYAFVSFPVPGTRRTFDPVTHKVVYEDESMPLGGKILIEPISVEQQLNWRKEFAGRMSDLEDAELAKAIKAQNPFKDFSRLMRQRPDLGKSWNLFLLNKVIPTVERWADSNSIPREQCLQLNRPQSEEQETSRRELYQFFDSISIDDLLNLQIPLRWVVGRSKRPD